MFSESSLQPLQAFAERQSKMMIETANLHTHVHDPMNDIAEQWTNKTQEWNLMQEAKHLDDGLAKETSEHSEPAKPAATTPKENIEEGVVSQDRPLKTLKSPGYTSILAPSPAPPFSIPITFINTPTRTYCTKEQGINTNPFTLTFNQHTRHYDILDENHNPSYFLYTFHPLNLKVVSWAPGSLDVHTQTKDYDKKSGKGEYVNLRVQTVEALEALVEGLKARGVPSKRFDL
ncbi:MAG: hypothetical protein L6R40_007078 [Gallowayella cf. fulva]|nr:MAG: hypothetical protein L6R40_007078 [Xanthomendoza cf. fulva]